MPSHLSPFNFSPLTSDFSPLTSHLSLLTSHFSLLTSHPPLCYFLYLASPLTLSEVRSMLPPGLTADLGSSSDQQALRAIHRDAATVARILSGRCSCDLARPRLSEPTEDERHLRERYRQLKVPRETVITALERHRRPEGVRSKGVDWATELWKFVAEHARNAGPTLYYLTFSPDSATLSLPAKLRPLPASAATGIPHNWLQEGTLTLITR